MLRIKERSTYVSSNGNDTFVYEVSGTAAELKAYAKAKGEYHVVDNGIPLFFTTDYVGPTGTLLISAKSGKVFADKSAYKKAASLAGQFEGPLGAAIANRLVDQLLGGNAPSTITNAEEPSVSDDGSAEEL